MRNKCILCGESLQDSSLMNFDNFPASAQDIPTKKELSIDKGISLNLCQCSRCGLVQFDCEPVPYYKDVIRAGGLSSTMRELRKSQYEELLCLYPLKGKKIIEVGCGQGEFLSVWSDFDVNAVGIENSASLVEKAQAKGLNVVKGFVDDANTKIEGAPFDAFVQFNFLEHQPHPNDMIKGIYNNLTDNGVGLVTVPSLEYILKYNGYYELIHDHIAYYSADAIRLLFEKNGFDIVSVKTVNRDTHQIIVKKRQKITLGRWNENYKKLKSSINGYIDGVKNKGGKVAIWGASHQGFTMIPTLGIENKIEYIIDSADFKQGKYAPASHVPIVSPNDFPNNPVNAIIIVAPGYTDEISRIIKSKYGDGVEISTLRSDKLEVL